VAGEILLDTGALVSLLDRSQTFHGQCVEFFRRSEAPLVTTEAVLTESTYLLSGIDGGDLSCLDFVRSQRIEARGPPYRQPCGRSGCAHENHGSGSDR
jgi:predicted nucleic acid-binding protein